MSSFDFTSLIAFITALFEALQRLAEKLGFSFDFGEGETAAPSETPAE